MDKTEILTKLNAIASAAEKSDDGEVRVTAITIRTTICALEEGFALKLATVAGKVALTA